MMIIPKSHYSARDLSDMRLTCLPSTERNILRRATQEKWPFRTRAGRGGGREYAVDGLPADVQQEIKSRCLKTELATLSAPQLPIEKTKDSASLTERQRRVADARQGVLHAMQKIMESDGCKVKRAAQKLLDIAHTEPAGHVASMLRLARDPRGSDGGEFPSVRSLQRFIDRAKCHELAPRVKRKDMTIPAWAPLFLSYWQRPEKPSVDHAYRRFAAEWQGEMPSIHQVRRFIEKIGNVSREVGRRGANDLKNIKAFKRRTFDHLLPTDVYSADGHTFDAEVQHPDHGRPFKPEITSIVDIATRRLVGWSIGLAESSLAVLDAIRVAATVCGSPAIFYVDNGSGYKNAMMNDAATGLMARMGTTLEHSLPYNSQARGVIERLHKTVWVTGAKELAGYMGADMDREAKNAIHKISRAELKTRGKTQAITLTSWEDFKRFCVAKVDEYNNRPHRSLPKIVDPVTGLKRHSSPNEQWAWFVEQGFVAQLEDETAAPLFRPQALRTAQRCEINLFGNRYFARALEEFNGEQLAVGYDIHDASRVWVYSEDGRLICIAELNGNNSAYFAKPVVQQAREKRAKGRLKRVDAAREEIIQELNGGRPAIEHQDTITIGAKTYTREELNASKLPVNDAEAEPAPLQLYIPSSAGQAEQETQSAAWQVPSTPEARFEEFNRLSVLAEAEVPEEAQSWLTAYPTSSEYLWFGSLKKSTHARERKSA